MIRKIEYYIQPASATQEEKTSDGVLKDTPIKDIYTQLREGMDKIGLGFSATDSGVEL